jgi:hypothetical protein
VVAAQSATCVLHEEDGILSGIISEGGSCIGSVIPREGGGGAVGAHGHGVKDRGGGQGWARRQLLLLLMC